MQRELYNLNERSSIDRRIHLARVDICTQINEQMII